MIYYYIAQKYKWLDRQEHNTADKSRGKGWMHAQSQLFYRVLLEDEIEATLARRRKNAFGVFYAVFVVFYVLVLH